MIARLFIRICGKTFEVIKTAVWFLADLVYNIQGGPKK